MGAKASAAAGESFASDTSEHSAMMHSPGASSDALPVPPGDHSRLCSLRRSSTLTLGDGKVRKVCKYGVQCYMRNPKHIEEFCHPADVDYHDACRAESREPEFVSIMSIFVWCDKDGSGKAAKDEVAAMWPRLQAMAPALGEFTEERWQELDDDGNGFANFSEFAEFTTKHKVNLPLGLDALLGESNERGPLRCGVTDCFCMEFAERRARCKYGAECYQRNPDHKKHFVHPNDPDWKTAKPVRDTNMCRCGHKLKLHASAAVGAGSVEYPSYWTLPAGDEFNALVQVGDEYHARIQSLVDFTYSDVTTRDRVRHSGSWMVPRNYTVTFVKRNENSRLWRKYTYAKLSLQKEKQLADENPEVASQLPEYSVVSDVVTTEAWEASAGEPLDKNINEWYLWHGTSQSAAENICANDFKLRLAGSATGTLYGRGTYFAESFTKADEYAKQEGGVYTILLCRVLGGRVQQSDDRSPDAEQLTRDCVEGPYDCVVGDRRKVSGTYREFIIFDAENVYPEYVVSYTRGELFKSKSHP